MIEEKEQRIINISAKPQNQILVIVVRNPKNENTIPRLQRKVIHGYGLLNVYNTVKRYGGEININDGVNEFSVNIIIPECWKFGYKPI